VPFVNLAKGCVAIARDVNAIALHFQGVGQHVAQTWFVINDKNLGFAHLGLLS
jgi:hypothetical protein